MDFVFLIDTIGEPATHALLGALLGLAFGGLTFATGFCTRSAIFDLTRFGRGFEALSIWLIAFAVAIGGTQALIAFEVIDLVDSRFLSGTQSLSGALIGGAAFGIGMVLTRGCASRLLVLSAGGNLRAFFTIGIIAVTAWLTLQNVLVPLRNSAASMFTAPAASWGAEISGNILALTFIILAIALGVRSVTSAWKLLGAAIIGALIPVGWWATANLSDQVFEPIAVESLSFLRPLANTINFALSNGSQEYLSMDIGLAAGAFMGAFLVAIISGRFKLESFTAPNSPHIARYISGGALMGFGGILAGGCTVGAGFSGGSVMAISAFIALASMIGSAALTDILLDKPSWAAEPKLAPAQ